MQVLTRNPQPATRNYLGPKLTIVIGSNGNSRISLRSASASIAISVRMSISSERYSLL